MWHFTEMSFPRPTLVLTTGLHTHTHVSTRVWYFTIMMSSASHVHRSLDHFINTNMFFDSVFSNFVRHEITKRRNPHFSVWCDLFWGVSFKRSLQHKHTHNRHTTHTCTWWRVQVVRLPIGTSYFSLNLDQMLFKSSMKHIHVHVEVDIFTRHIGHRNLSWVVLFMNKSVSWD